MQLGILLRSSYFFLRDALFPQFCCSCGAHGFLLCLKCSSLLPSSVTAYCVHCDEAVCVCTVEKIIDGAHYLSFYSDPIMRRAIHALKYRRERAMGPLLGIILARAYLSQRFLVDAIIPIPLHFRRRAFRGFNQAEEIGKMVGESLGIPLLTDTLKKRRSTAPQALQIFTQRRDNVAGSFVVKGGVPQRVLLLDDVVTSGSTVIEAAQTLKKAGVQKVYVVSLARG